MLICCNAGLGIRKRISREQRVFNTTEDNGKNKCNTSRSTEARKGNK